MHVHPNQRLAFALVLSLALWVPTLTETLAGSIDILQATLRWVVAFTVATMGVRVISNLVEAYSADVEAARMDRPDRTADADAD